MPFEIRTEGSLPVQYTESKTATSRQDTVLAMPYLSVLAVREFAPGLTSTVFAEGGHAPLGQFRDGESTFVSFGGNIVQRWGQFSVGASLDRSTFYDGSFASVRNIASDVDVFARYSWRPSADFRVTPSAAVTIRSDEAFALQRTSLGGRVDVERRLSGPWWLVAIPRVRYSNYAGDEAGRRDFTASMVAGLKYQFNENITARMLAGYENRSSNVTARDRETFIAGVSLDFEFTLERPRWR